MKHPLGFLTRNCIHKTALRHTAMVLVALVGSVLHPGPLLAQGLTRVTFDGAPSARPPGDAVSLSEYSESGMIFRLMNPSGDFQRLWPEFSPARPYNGTIVISSGRRGLSEVVFGLEGALPFDLASVDLAEFSRPQPALVPFLGYRRDGSVVSTRFTTDGILNGAMGDFETFRFDAEFSNLMRVEIPAVGGHSTTWFSASFPSPARPRSSRLAAPCCWPASDAAQDRDRGGRDLNAIRARILQLPITHMPL